MGSALGLRRTGGGRGATCPTDSFRNPHSNSDRFQNEIEDSNSACATLTYLEQQLRFKQRIGRVARFSRKIELSRQDRTMRRLEPNMVMAGPPRIQTGYDGFQRVFSVGIRKLMASASKSIEVVLAVGIGVPEIE